MNIYQVFEEAFDAIFEWFDNLVTEIIKLPETIKEFIIEIFVPDNEYIEQKFQTFLNDLKLKFGFDTSIMTGLFDSATPVEDTYADIPISGVGTFHVKVFDSKFFSDGVAYFRPFIRGFLVLMMALYHIRQLIGFFGYDAGVVAGRSEHIASARKSQE